MFLTLAAAIIICAVDTNAVMDPTCPEMEQCFNDTMGSTEDGSVLDNKVYNQLVQAYAEFTSCYETSKALCNDTETLRDLEIEMNVLGYICSIEGKRDIDALAESQCHTDPLKAKNSSEVITQCAQNFKNATTAALADTDEPASQETCPYFKLLLDCIFLPIDKMCGKAYANFVINILVLSFDNQCNSKSKTTRDVINFSRHKRFFPEQII